MLTTIVLIMIAVLVVVGTMMHALVTDTTSTPINGKDGSADFLLQSGSDQISYKCILDGFRVREIIEMTRSDTFCTEGSADQEPGRSQIQFEITGVGKKNGPASGPLIPAPQGVAITMQFSAGCTLAISANFTEAAADRQVNQTMRIGGRGLSKGTYVLTWDKTP